MEAAGLLPADKCCDDTTSGHCSTNDCGNLESGYLTPATNLLLKDAPVPCCQCMICSACIRSSFEIVLLTERPASDIEYSIEWIPRWSFEHRQALPARFPSLV